MSSQPQGRDPQNLAISQFDDVGGYRHVTHQQEYPGELFQVNYDEKVVLLAHQSSVSPSPINFEGTGPLVCRRVPLAIRLEC